MASIKKDLRLPKGFGGISEALERTLQRMNVKQQLYRKSRQHLFAGDEVKKKTNKQNN